MKVSSDAPEKNVLSLLGDIYNDDEDDDAEVDVVNNNEDTDEKINNTDVPKILDGNIIDRHDNVVAGLNCDEDKEIEKREESITKSHKNISDSDNSDYHSSRKHKNRSRSRSWLGSFILT